MTIYENLYIQSYHRKVITMFLKDSCDYKRFWMIKNGREGTFSVCGETTTKKMHLATHPMTRLECMAALKYLQSRFIRSSRI